MVQHTAASLKVIVFRLMDKEYAVPVNEVQSIEKVMPLTRVPNTPSYVKGVINLRGIITPILSLRERFEMVKGQEDEHTRIIITTLEEYTVGLIVDAAKDVLDLDIQAIEPQPEVFGTVEAEYISGVAKVDNRLIVLLDLKKVLNSAKSDVDQYA
ncbi:chemotaxis protein CheW [Chungangia koreensis]|uniref:Chemotaxis protein CheW n=1 Tax=Chungangia koreensis TaxID=752657 RepID=A0ABV8X2I4_9LACT